MAVIPLSFRKIHKDPYDFDRVQLLTWCLLLALVGATTQTTQHKFDLISKRESSPDVLAGPDFWWRNVVSDVCDVNAIILSDIFMSGELDSSPYLTSCFYVALVTKIMV